jgi:hypothetical protein
MAGESVSNEVREQFDELLNKGVNSFRRFVLDHHHHRHRRRRRRRHHFLLSFFSVWLHLDIDE